MDTHFDRVGPVIAEGENFRVTLLLPDNRSFNFTLTDQAAAVLAQRFLYVASDLKPGEQRIINSRVGFTPIWTGVEPGIAIDLAPNLTIAFALGEPGVRVLRTCVEQLEQQVVQMKGPKN